MAHQPKDTQINTATYTKLQDHVNNSYFPYGPVMKGTIDDHN